MCTTPTDMNVDPRSLVCPTCGARQVWADTCRRCKCDLTLVRQLLSRCEALRRSCLIQFNAGNYDQALQIAQACYQLAPDRDVARLVRPRMLAVYPQLADARIDYAWGGTLALTMRRLPYLARVAPGVVTAAGYSGHGVALATMAGRILAEAVAGTAERFDLMAALPCERFPGGQHLRWPLLALAMTYYALKDRW